MSEYLDAINNSTENIRSSAYHLLDLSSAFFQTGNECIGEKLDYIAKNLLDNQKEINNAVSKELNDRCDSSYKDVGETLSLFLEKSIKEMDSMVTVEDTVDQKET